MVWLIVTSYLVIGAISADAQSCLNPSDDPCEAKNHQNLNDETRSSGYFDIFMGFKDDFTMSAGWYKSISLAGTEMPYGDPPQVYHCQAVNPIYLKDIKSTGEIESYEACAASREGGCDRTYTVCKKKCSEFNVYYLPSVIANTDRYCFGKEVKCKPPLTSATGFSPCEDPNQKIDTPPVLKIEVIDIPLGAMCESVTVFSCDNPGLKVNVEMEFKVDGQQVKTQQMTPDELPYHLSYGDILKKLPGAKFPIQVECIMTKVNDAGEKTGESKAATFDAGYKIASTELNIEEGSKGEVIIDFTTPFKCTYQCSKPECDVYINIDVPEKSCDVDPVTGRCRHKSPCVGSGELNFVKDTTDEENLPCTAVYKFNPLDLENLPQIRLPFVGADDGLIDGTTELNLKLSVALETQDLLWQDTDFPEITVNIKDRNSAIQGKYCRFIRDPHALSFDGKKYEMQLIDTFILFRHTKLPIEIQGFFGPSRAWSRVCGCAVRSGDDVFVMNFCGRRGFYRQFYSCDKAKNKPEGLTEIPNLEVMQVEKKLYHVILPTGMIVEIHPGYIKIWPSVHDIGNAEGQCGTLNDNTKDDFTMPDGKTTKNKIEFAESWRVAEKDSLFLGNVPDDRTYGSKLYCSCREENGKNIPNCRYAASTGSCTSTGTSMTDKLRKNCKGPGDEFKPIDKETIDSWDPETPDWHDGWTEEKAREHCEDYFNQREATNLCKDVPGVNVEGSMEDCMLDIKITGTTDYIATPVEEIISTCIKVETGNPNGPKDEILKLVCAANCSDNGDCINGKCMCDEGFIGSDCSVNVDHTPNITHVGKDGKCDIASETCEEIYVYGDLFIEGPNLHCRMQVTNFDESQAEKIKEKAVYEHFQKVLCPVPDGIAPYIVDIEITNNDKTYSNSKPLVVINSDNACWDCDREMEGGCTIKANKCFIDEICYDNLDKNPENKDEYCNPDEDPYGWTSSIPATLDKDPVIDFKIEIKKDGPDCESSTIFQCHNPGTKVAKVAVEWLIDDQVVKSGKVKSGDLPFTLSYEEIMEELHGKRFPFKMTCKMTQATDIGTTGETRSTEFEAGYKIAKTELNIEEGSKGKVAIDFTVPFNCKYACTSQKCNVNINVEVPDIACKVDEATGTCKYPQTCRGNNELKFVKDTTAENKSPCTYVYTFNPSDVENLPQLKIPFEGADDGFIDGDTELDLQLAVAQITDDKLWQDVSFPPIKVNVLDKNQVLTGKYCRFIRDPHGLTFDQRKYEMQLIDTFTLFRHKKFPIEIQGFFGPSKSWSRVCGCAVRSGDDVFIMNFCGKRGFYRKFYSCDKPTNIPEGVKKLPNLEVIQVERKLYHVILPTGMKVEVHPGYIKIWPSVLDIDNAEGQCGTLNDDTKDDFTMPDGKTTKNNIEFAESWRVTEKKNLFLGNMPDKRNYGQELFCSCGEMDNNEIMPSCRYASSTGSCTSSGTSLTEQLKGKCLETDDEKDDDEDDEFEPIKKNILDSWDPEPPEWRKGWTEEKAREHCENYFYQREGVDLCKEVPGIDIESSIEDCMLDIKITATTEYIATPVNEIISTCRKVITDGAGGDKEMLKVLCPANCSDNGECLDGKCQCFEGYEEIDCSVKTDDEPPELFPFIDNGKCNKAEKPCELFPVHGSSFTPNLCCFTQILPEHGRDESEVVVTNVTYEHFQEVYCPVPKADLPYTFRVNVHSCEKSYPTDTRVLVYNSKCWTCRSLLKCKKKKLSCVIDGECYGKNEVNPNDTSEFCNPKKSTSKWTRKC